MEQIEFYEAKLKYEIDACDLFDLLKESKDIIIIDPRVSEEYTVAHLPKAVNFPYRLMNEDSVKQLDPSKLYVVYSDGIGCNASTKGALRLTKLGFNVKELIGGMEWWVKDGFEIQMGKTKLDRD